MGRIDMYPNVSAQFAYLNNAPACRVSNNGTQTLNNNTVVAITYDNTIHDVYDMHVAGNPSRLTAVRSGVYHIFGEVSLTGETDYFSILVQIRLNGATQIGANRLIAAGTFSADQPRLAVSTDYYLAAGEWVDMALVQENTSANAETTVAGCFFGMTWQCSGTL